MGKNLQRKAKVTYRGWAGHFCAAHDCRFRLNTLIELGDRRIVVSTVGLMENSLSKRGFSEIGHNRYYETMAFEAYWTDDPGCWDADIHKELSFEAPWSYSSIKDELKAQAGHEVVVEEFVKKLESEVND